MTLPWNPKPKPAQRTPEPAPMPVAPIATAARDKPAKVVLTDTPETATRKAKQARRVGDLFIAHMQAPKPLTHPTRASAAPRAALPHASQAPRAAPVPRPLVSRPDRR